MLSSRLGVKTSPFKITCRNYPPEFNLDKTIAKDYFRQFGKLKRVVFKPKLRMCTVEYLTQESFLKAVQNAGEYQGSIFEVFVEKPHETKKRSEKIPPSWMNDDIEAELKAMHGVGDTKEITSENFRASIASYKPVNKKKTNKWDLEVVKKKSKVKKIGKIFAKNTILSEEHMTLINLVLSQSHNSEEKFKILDARDKLLRLKLKERNSKKISGATLGTCPDMCPEKERLMREIQHQVALYEQDNGKNMDHRKAIKQYSRSSADQESSLPHELRPVAVLQMTMCYLMHNILDLVDTSDVNISEWYHFLWDRTRSIRKDITQQELCCQGAVELVEQCARFHIHCSARLVGEELSVFDEKINTENLTKCLQTLKYMYHDLELKNEYCANESEFRGYVILLNMNDGNFMWEVQQLRQEIQKSSDVKFALQVYSALDKNNYIKFFKLVNSTNYLNACILMRYFVQVRSTALKFLVNYYAPRATKILYPLGELTSLLGFDDVNATMDFLEYNGLPINDEKSHVVLDKTTFTIPKIPYVLDRSYRVVEFKRIHSVGRTICGKDLPPKDFENSVPQNSFDSKGYLISKDFLEEEELEQVSRQISQELAVQETNDEIDAFKEAEEPKNVSILKQPAPPTPSTIFQQSSFASGTIFQTKPDPISLGVQPKSILDEFQHNIFANKDLKMPKSDGGFSFKLTETEKAKKQSFPTSLFSLPQVSTKNEEFKLFQKSEPQSEVGPTVFTKPTPDKVESMKQKNDEQKEKERRRMIEMKKKKQEEELQRRLDELRKEKAMLNKKIHVEVKAILEHIVIEVDEKIRRQKVMMFKRKVQDRKMLIIVNRWRKLVVKRRKRKAVDCTPVWIDTHTPKEMANELHTPSESVTLSLIKRYKYGKPLNFEIIENDEITKINLFELTYPTIKDRFYSLTGTIQKSLYWKVVISMPDQDELVCGALRVEKALEDAFQWENENYTIEQIKLNGIESVTYCVEKQKGLDVVESDANGFIFIAKNFNTILQRRIFEHLKKFGVFTKIPIVIILEEYDGNDCKLKALQDAQILFDYLILINNLAPNTLLNSVEEGLVFLASKTENAPPLELDTFSSFIKKYLCSEIWRKANSFAKWNSQYKTCLKDPNTVIALYNEALKRLTKILLDKSIREYANFPEVFKDYLINEIPDFLPCGYQYFPKFCKSEFYLYHMEKLLKKLSLPKWQEKWPPSTEFELEVEMAKYCTKAFKTPETAFYKTMGLILKDIEPNVNFVDVGNLLWTHVVELQGFEKLNELSLGLKGTDFENKSIFNQYVVIYNKDLIERYSKSDWFYIGNTMIDSKLKKLLGSEKETVTEEKLPTINYEDLDKTIEDAMRLLNKDSDKTELKKQISDFNALLNDLETSIRIHKTINCKMGDELKRAIED